MRHVAAGFAVEAKLATAWASSSSVGIMSIKRVTQSTSRTRPQGCKNLNAPPSRFIEMNPPASALRPELSSCVTFVKFTKILRTAWPSNSRRRAATKSLSAPMVRRPSRSTMVTSPDCRVEIFSGTCFSSGNALSLAVAALPKLE